MRRRMAGESIAEVGDDIRQLAQKAYYDLDLAAQESLALNQLFKDGILGQDFLLKEVSKVNYQRMVLHTIHNQEIQCWIGGKANMICRVEIKDNMTIPPMTSTMMPVEIPGVNHLTEYGLIEGTTGTAKSTLTIPGIINTQDQVHFVNVVNYGDDEVKLYKKRKQ
ncbi:Hypothetical predicted protein [Mytilus galloprovincialis]|uniref:Uncharacterized protein n=1 Tax=Mytilus galloprovincialis TaxID=29158 RepID=A0A8B6FXE2_MYTGA|nr:Hypothetical predicted protein [Mytilus galloprovincialis]